MPERDAVDVTNCDREPIHIPGAIQPHGVLLALQEPDLVINQASGNAPQLLRPDVSDLVGRPLSEVLSADAMATVQAAVRREVLAECNPLRLTVRNQVCDVVLHRHDGALIMEIEPRVQPAEAERTHHPLRHAVLRLQTASTLGELLEHGARAVSRLTGFERVLIYSFDEDGHGQVDAEVRADGFESYLGLHYPASDIPRQARDLYLRIGIRNIPDARYTPAPLIPPLRPDRAAPLDLSFAVLRSVSPVHLEYLANMGVRASMSISLVVGDRLWGLISCAQHSGPHHVPYEVRSDCELLGRTMALLVGAFEDRETAAARQRRRPALARLSVALRADDDALAALLERPRELFELLRIDGAAILSEDVQSAGRVPPPESIRAIAKVAQQWDDSGVFTTDSLSRCASEFSAIADVASGLISFTLPGSPPRRFLGFRPELAHTVNWGGDPRKLIEDDAGARLHPRRSFALWREDVRWRSQPWQPTDQDAAEELRRLVVEVDLEKQVEREQRAVRSRDDLVAVVSHDLKNPLNIIQMQAVLLRHVTGADHEDRSSRLRASLDTIQRSVAHMDAMIHDLLDLSRIEAGRFVVQPQAEPMLPMVEEALLILRPLADAKRLELRAVVESGVEVLADRERIFQVLSNLVGNAIKFTPAGGSIELRASAAKGRALFAVTDTGPGLVPEQLAQLFNRYWQASKTGRDGSGLGLYIAKGIVEAHGGMIWAEHAEAGGATFKFTLPLVEAD